MVSLCFYSDCGLDVKQMIKNKEPGLTALIVLLQERLRVKKLIYSAKELTCKE